MLDREDPPADETIATPGGERGPGAGDAAVLDGAVPGALIGRYRLVRPLGEGGFGTVYEAEQLEPVTRRVALKIIKLGMDTREVIARFETERQVLALMDHPNIAKVLDAGATESGRPYFVMELVEGVPVTEFCDRHRLPTGERLRLFAQICQAVQHAHQKGIIHRDLKPSNVLVAEVDGKPVPRVIDFGIAKATNASLIEKTLFTEFGRFIGTPEYMSPEQAELTAVDVDTRSDIYSLGVLLYEMLTGTTPFEGRVLRRAGYAEIQRIIREEDPPRPSTRVHSLGGSLEQVAAVRRERADRLARTLRGELDWIVMKCLEKDRGRRYETANGLARDVERYLTSEPVAASPPSRSYRLRKLVRRHRVVFATGAAMFALLAAGVVGTGIGLIRAKRAEAHAVSEAMKAETTAGFLTDMLQGVGPSVARGRDTEMLRDILSETDREIGLKLAGQPEVEASIRSFLGKTYYDLGEFDRAKEQYDRALELHRRLFGERHERVAQDLNDLALVRWGQAELLEAERLCGEALALRRDLTGPRSPEAASSERDLANILVAQNRYREAEAPLRDAIEIQREVLGADAEEELATSLNSLGNVLMHLSRFAEAGPFYDEAFRIHTHTLGADHPFTIADLHNLGWLAFYQNDYATSEARFREAVEVSRKIFGKAHPRLVEALTGHASCLQRLGRYREAIDLAREAVAMDAELFGADHLNTADAMGTLANILSETGPIAENDELNRRILEIRRRQLGDTDPRTLSTLHNIAYGHYQRGNLEVAEKMFRESLIAYEKANGREHHETALVINNLGRVLRDAGKLDEAARCFEEARAIRTKVMGPEHVVVTVSLHDLAATRTAQGRLDEAAEMYEQVLREYPVRVGPTNRAVGIAEREFARLELDRGRAEHARELAEAARTILATALGEKDQAVIGCDLLRAAALGRLGKTAEAESLFAAGLPRFADAPASRRASALLLHGRFLADAGRPAEAERVLAEALALYRDKFGEAHYSTREAAGALALVHSHEPR